MALGTVVLEVDEAVEVPMARPRSPCLSASTAPASPWIVGCSKTSPRGALTTKAFRISKMSRVAKME